LLPKIAIFTSTVDEIRKIVKPALEKLLAEKGIPLSKILVNVGGGNPDLTGNDEIRHFNNLDIPGTEGSKNNLFFYVAKERKAGTAVHFSLLPFFAVHFLQFLFCKVPCAACGR
jgi:hypothetical protein